MTNVKTTKTDIKAPTAKWVKETELVDGRPYLIQHGSTVYPVVYNANIQHFVGYGYNERVKPDFVLEYEPHNV